MSGEIRDAVKSWRDVPQAIRRARADGTITPTETKEILQEIGEAVGDTLEAIGVSVERVRSIKEMLAKAI